LLGFGAAVACGSSDAGTPSRTDGGADSAAEAAPELDSGTPEAQALIWDHRNDLMVSVDDRVPSGVTKAARAAIHIFTSGPAPGDAGTATCPTSCSGTFVVSLRRLLRPTA
jgi:hypothetical protein